jgi:phospholipase C
MPREVSRRSFLRGSAGVVGGLAVASAAPALAARGRRPSSLRDIEHVVILIQENRSFDHYFGTLSGVRGFADPSALQQPDGMPVFAQPDGDALQNPSGQPYILPWRLNTRTMNGQGAHGLSHAWSVQHYSWNDGLMDGFVTAHRVGDDNAPPSLPPTNYAPVTMGYFTRADLPFHYALADAFTVCDGYHCSVFGPTNPNRIMSLSATVDADGSLGGGPCVDNGQAVGQLKWTAYPERLQQHGIDWFVYQEVNCDTNNMLPLFAAFQDPTTDLYRRANTIIPTPPGQRFGPALLAKLRDDVVSGRLPAVSWILASDNDCEHPSATPGYGARFIAGVIEALRADLGVWAKTALFVTYDENDGFFDHVVPPTPPPGTAGEFLSPTQLVGNSSTVGWSGPVGLGFRVPMLVVSPFSRGGYCCPDTFDHTSLLLFLERRFGIEVPNLSEWRRATVGDLTSAFNFAGGVDLSLPPLPDGDALAAAADAQQALPAAAMPAAQSMPAQEPDRRPRPSGIVPARR